MSWRNTTIRFTNVGWFPYVETRRDDFGQKTLTGLTGHMLHFIVKSLGMKYEVVFPNDHQWGTLLPNGSWTGMIGDLTKNAADIAVGPFVMTEDEAIAANPSLPYADEDLVIMSGVEKEHQTNVYGYITTMDYQVWLLLLASCLVIMSLVGVMDYIMTPYMTRRQRRTRFWRIFWVFWAAIFLEGSVINFKTTPHRVILASWLLGVMVIMHMFIGYMESTLMVKSETFRINRVEQLLQMPYIKPMIYDIGGYTSIFETEDSHTFKMVKEQVEKHGEDSYGDEMFTPDYLRRVLKKKAVVLMEPLSLYTRVGPQCKEFKGEGLFHIGKQRLLQIKMVFYMRKKLDRRIQTEIQKRVRLVIDSGIFRHWHDSLIFDKGACWTAEHSDHMHDYQDLHYSDLASIFYFYFCALYVSFNVLLIEIIYRKNFCCYKFKDRDAENDLKDKLKIKEQMKRDGVYGIIEPKWDTPMMLETISNEPMMLECPTNSFRETSTAKTTRTNIRPPNDVGYLQMLPRSVFPGNSLRRQLNETGVSRPIQTRHRSAAATEYRSIYDTAKEMHQVVIAQPLQMNPEQSMFYVKPNDNRPDNVEELQPDDAATENEHGGEVSTGCIHEDTYQYISRKINEELDDQEQEKEDEAIYSEVTEENLEPLEDKKWVIRVHPV